MSARNASSAAVVVVALSLGHAESLRVKTDTTGVRVLVDDKEAGLTPLTIDPISPGTHQLTLSKSGYADHTEPVRVERGKPNSVFIVMKKRTETAAPPALPMRQRALHAHSNGSCSGWLSANENGMTFEEDGGKDRFDLPWSAIWIISRYLFGGGATVHLYVLGGSVWSWSQIRAADWKKPAHVPWVRVESNQRSYTFFAVPEAGAENPPSPEALNASLFDTLGRSWQARKVEVGK